MNPPFPHRPDIDGLRALAILPVIFFHLGVAGFSGGFVGVDIFFVISGYLITAIIHREMVEGRFSFVGFFERRVRRIVPALMVVLTATTIAALVLLLPYDLIEFDRSLASAALGLANLRFLEGSGYFDGPSLTKPLLHTWSLSLEEQFYLVFPPLMLVLLRYGKGWIRPGLGLLTLASFAAGLWMVAYWPKVAFYLPLFRAWEFLAGALLALGALPPIASRRGRMLSGWGGLALILVAVGCLDGMTPNPGPAILLPVVGTGLLLHAGHGGWHPVGRILAWRPLVFIGLISYSLYLWHWPLIVFTRYVTVQSPDLGGQATILVVSFLLAWATWRWVERPFRGKSGWGSRRRVMRGAAMAACVCVLVAFTAEWSHGWPQRMPERVLELEAQSSNRPMSWLAIAAKLSPSVEAKLEDWIRARHFKPNDSLPRLDPFEGGSRYRIGPDGSDPEYALWGDSHARNFVTELSKSRIADRHGGVVLAGSGCAPLLGTVSSSKGAQCRAFNQRVAEWIVSTPSIRTVFLAAHWGVYAAMGPYHDSPVHPRPLLPGASLSENPKLFKEAMQRTQAFFERRGVQVVWVIDNPDPGWDVPNVMARAERWWGTLPAMLTLEEHRERQKTMFETLSLLAAKGPVQVLDPTSLLCSAGVCPVKEGEIPLYRDDNHLSPLGVSKVMPLLEEALLARLEPERRASVSP